MDHEIMNLLQMLSKKKYITLKEIELNSNITRRQATYRIEKINEILKFYKISPITIGSSKEIKIDDKMRKKLGIILHEMEESNEYYMNKRERQIYMYLMLFMNHEYLSLNDFINFLKVSRSTVLLDFKELMQILEENNIKVRNNRKRGYFLVGSEMDIRRMMMKLVIYTLSEEQHSKIFDVFIEDFHLDIFEYSRLVISELSKQHNIHFVEDRLVEFIYIFIFLKARIQSGKYADEEIKDLMDVDAISSMKEYDFSVELLKNYKNTEHITQGDLNYISSWILGISFGDILEETKDCIFISDMVGKIMTRFEYLSGVHYQDKEEIFIQLYSHFRPAYYRLLFKLPIFNPLCDKVKEEYGELYQLMEETMKPFHVIFGEKIPSGEIAYLTMHFASIYSGKNKLKINRQKIALVACSNGIGSSAILYNELKEMFPELHFLPPVETAHIQDVDSTIDIIFSTSYVKYGVDIGIPVIRVTPVMSMAERYQVMRDVYMQLGSDSLKQPNIDVVMNIIEKYADIQQEDDLYNELIFYFSQNENDKEKEKTLHLKEMIKPELIRLNIEATNWEEAVRLAYEPLVQHHYITQNYVEETIRSVKIVGPYIVITKHVALPHTKPECGALSIALGIGVLRSPVKFGNQDNDPVKYIFSLSAIDNQTHLTAMAELLELFNQKSFFKKLDIANNSREIMEYLN